MKKYVLFCVGVFAVTNANAEGVVLSDTYVSEEEPFVASEARTTNVYSGSQSNTYSEEQIQPVSKSLLSDDSSDPLFLIGDNQILSDTFVSYFDKKFRPGQYFGYGVNDNLVLSVSMLYQLDISGKHENGFSSTDFGGIYRINNGSGISRIISDAIFGLKVWGSSHVRTPEYADSSYYAGLRFGRQYTGVTLAGTIKSTWVFDGQRGLSYVDFIPEAYFRFQYDWRAGIGLDFRQSTNTWLLDDQEWLNLKLLRQYGNTQYVGHFDYEFESGEVQFGANIKILF